MFTVDPSDPTPIYAQLDRSIRAAIAQGRLAVGDRLPTVRQLAVDLRVNANTVAKVYAELERSGSHHRLHQATPRPRPPAANASASCGRSPTVCWLTPRRSASHSGRS